LVLDSKNRILSEEVLSVGTINASIADPREIFLKALKKNGVAVILLHNHPSGDPTPSREDIVTTKRIAKAGDLLGIPLKDHIILGLDSYISLNAEGYLKSE
jgi:DNA repair protein RadC